MKKTTLLILAVLGFQFTVLAQAPENLTLSNTSIPENSPPNTVVGVLSAEGSTNLTYYLVDDIEYFSYEFFKVANDTLYTIATFDFETQSEYQVTVGVYNQLGETTEETFIITIEDVANEDVQVIEILEETLDRVYYSRENFTQPTILVFPNLTTVTEGVYFDENVNLISVDLPLLSYVGEGFYISRNEVLESVNAPVLETVHSTLYVSRNTLLTELHICNLSYILPIMDEFYDETLVNPPYYYIENNPVLDYSTTCLEYTYIDYNEEDTLVQMARIMVGSFDANTDKPVSYYIIEDDKELTENENFAIEANALYLTKNIEEYNEDLYAMRIGALRTGNDASNALNQKIELDIEVDLSNKKVDDNNSFVSTYPFLNQFVDFNNCDGTKIEVYDFGHYVFALVETNAGVKMYSDFYDKVYCTGSDCGSSFNLSNPNETWTCRTIATPTCTDGIQNGDETGLDCGGSSCTPCENSGNVPSIFTAYPFLNQFVDYNNCNGAQINVYDFGHYVFATIETSVGIKMYNDFYDDVYCTGRDCANRFNLSDPADTWTCGVIATNMPAIFTTYPFLNKFVDYDNCEGAGIKIFNFGNYVFAIVESDQGVNMYANFYDGAYCSGDYCAPAYGLNNAEVLWSCGEGSQ